jgi:hypothetical protein
VIELSEQTVIEQLVERLAQKYPGQPAEKIVEVVRQNHARFDGRPVRDYIPLFVERPSYIDDRRSAAGAFWGTIGLRGPTGETR